MQRPNRRPLVFLALVAVGSTGVILLGSLAGGCVFSSSSSPEASVCSAVGSYVQSCGAGTTCQAAVVRDCTKVATSMSASAFNSLFYCATGTTTPTSCNASSPLASSCFLRNLAISGTETSADPAQARLTNDYCTACDPTNPKCGNSLYAAAPSPDGGTQGATLAVANDGTLQAIDSKCVPTLLTDAGIAACGAAFHACADPILAAAVYLPPECTFGAAPPPGSNDGG